MQAKHSWLLVPPAIALLIFLGPLGTAVGSGHTAASTKTAAEPAAEPATGPTLTQITSTLIGVLLLGGAGLAAFVRLRHRHGGGDGGPAVLRQSLRLSQRQLVHVLEFDDRLLLLGETDGHITVLDSNRGQAGADDDEVTERDDDGAVPRDLVIPRARPGGLPGKPRQRGGHGSRQPRDREADFRALLEKVRSGVQVQ